MTAPTCLHLLDTGMRRGQPCGRSLREGQDVCGYHTERSMAARRARATAQRQPQREARAARLRLQEAAPEMLKALKGLFAELPELWGDDVRDGQFDFTLMEEHVFAALQAIAKAEGRDAS